MKKIKIFGHHGVVRIASKQCFVSFGIFFPVNCGGLCISLFFPRYICGALSHLNGTESTFSTWVSITCIIFFIFYLKYFMERKRHVIYSRSQQLEGVWQKTKTSKQRRCPEPGWSTHITYNESLEGYKYIYITFFFFCKCLLLHYTKRQTHFSPVQ